MAKTFQVRRSLSRPRLFLWFLLVAFLASSLPVLAGAKGAFMRVSPLKAGHSKRIEGANNPVSRVDPDGLHPGSLPYEGNEAVVDALVDPSSVDMSYDTNKFDRGNNFDECMANCIASKDPLSALERVALYAAGGPIPKSVAAKIIGRRNMIPGQSSFTSLPSIISAKLKAGGRSALRNFGRASSRLFAGYIAIFLIARAECYRVCSEENCES